MSGFFCQNGCANRLFSNSFIFCKTDSLIQIIMTKIVNICHSPLLLTLSTICFRLVISSSARHRWPTASEKCKSLRSRLCSTSERRSRKYKVRMEEEGPARSAGLILFKGPLKSLGKISIRRGTFTKSGKS
jgi:hypothetical protein